MGLILLPDSVVAGRVGEDREREVDLVGEEEERWTFLVLRLPWATLMLMSPPTLLLLPTPDGGRTSSSNASVSPVQLTVQSASGSSSGPYSRVSELLAWQGEGNSSHRILHRSTTGSPASAAGRSAWGGPTGRTPVGRRPVPSLPSRRRGFHRQTTRWMQT